jgi:D-hexose-6-phosphate mutarotase
VPLRSIPQRAAKRLVVADFPRRAGAVLQSPRVEIMPKRGDSEWRQFLCVEASNILDAAINLAPGQKHRMAAGLALRLRSVEG